MHQLLVFQYSQARVVRLAAPLVSHSRTAILSRPSSTSKSTLAGCSCVAKFFSNQPSHSKPTSLQLLAARITAHADAIATYGLDKSHPGSRPGDSHVPDQMRVDLTALRDTITEISILTTDAKQFVPDLAVRNNQFASLRWLIRFRISEALPLKAAGDELVHKENCEASRDNLTAFPSLPYATVAEKTGVPLHQLRSIARMAMLAGFLSEPSPDQLAHSPLSADMVKQPELTEWARFITSTSAPMVSAMVEATERWGDDRSINKTAYAAAWRTELPLFAHVASSSELQARYAAYMRVMTQSEGMALSHLLQGWEKGWFALASRGGVLVDVGGSAGHVSLAVSRRFPGIRVLAQDHPEVVERAQQSSSAALEAEGMRIAFQGHDFFLPQPARPGGFEAEGKGDVYLLRQIIHDWGDKEAITILRHLVHALEKAGPNARLIVMDTALPKPGEGSRGEEALLRVRDLTMQQAHNAHERTRAEWEHLLKNVHPNLTVQEVVQPSQSLMAIIEIALEVE